MSQFFKRCTNSSSEMIVCYGRELTPEQCIQLLQILVIKAGALKFEEKIKKLTCDFSLGSQTLEKKIYERTNLLQENFVTFFNVLISLEDGSPHSNVNFSDVENALVEIDNTIKKLFNSYGFFIWALQSRLIDFIQKQLKTESLIAEVPILFETQSLRSFLECKLTVTLDESSFVSEVAVSETQKSLDDLEILKNVIHNILEKEPFLNSTSDELLYVASLRQDFLYDIQENQILHLIELDVDKLSILAKRWLSTETNVTEERWHKILQLFAIVSVLYNKITHQVLHDQDLSNILLTLKASNHIIQGQTKNENPSILMLNIILQSLQGRMIYIEGPSVHLMEDKAFPLLQILDLSYEVIDHNLSVVHPKLPTQQPTKISYVDMEGLNSNPESLPRYLTEALIRIKALALQPLSMWYQILMPQEIATLYFASQTERERYTSFDEDLSPGGSAITPVSIIPNVQKPPVFFQQLFQTYLQFVNNEWIEHIKTSAPFTNLQQIDKAIADFQSKNLIKIWDQIEQQCLVFAQDQYLKAGDIAKLEFLQEHKSRIQQNLVLPIYTRSDVLKGTIIPSVYSVKDLASVRLHYEKIYLPTPQKQALVRQYIKRQYAKLHGLCPNIKANQHNLEQLKYFIIHLANLSPKEYSPSIIAAVQICLDLYFCIEALLPFKEDAEIQQQITHLSIIAQQNPLVGFSETLRTQLDWITYNSNFYFRWVERPIVKQSAQMIHDLARALSLDPQNTAICKQLIQALYEQEARLSLIWWYFSFARFFGFSNTHEILIQALHSIEEMVKLGQVSVAAHQEAREAALCAPFMNDFKKYIQGYNVNAKQKIAWDIFLLRIQKIQNDYSGYGMLYELKDYLLSKQGQFAQIEGYYFFGTKKVDPVGELLKLTDSALSTAPPQSLNRLDPLFLRQKANQLQEKEQFGNSKLEIQSHYLGQQYFDIWMTPTPHAFIDQSVIDPFKNFDNLFQEFQRKFNQTAHSASSSPAEKGFRSIMRRVSSANATLAIPKRESEKTRHDESFAYCRFYSKSELFKFMHNIEEQEDDSENQNII